MKDKRGNELKVGDTVFFKLKHNRGIEYGTVEGFTPKNVRVRYFKPSILDRSYSEIVPPRELMLGTIYMPVNDLDEALTDSIATYSMYKLPICTLIGNIKSIYSNFSRK